MAGSSASDLPAKISGSAPAHNSVQLNQIYLYPKILGDYQAPVNFLILKKVFFHSINCIKQHFDVVNDEMTQIKGSILSSSSEPHLKGHQIKSEALFSRNM